MANIKTLKDVKVQLPNLKKISFTSAGLVREREREREHCEVAEVCWDVLFIGLIPYCY